MDAVCEHERERAQMRTAKEGRERGRIYIRRETGWNEEKKRGRLKRRKDGNEQRGQVLCSFLFLDPSFLPLFFPRRERNFPPYRPLRGLSFYADIFPGTKIRKRGDWDRSAATNVLSGKCGNTHSSFSLLFPIPHDFMFDR